jgi:amino acid transporter
MCAMNVDRFFKEMPQRHHHMSSFAISSNVSTNELQKHVRKSKFTLLSIISIFVLLINPVSVFWVRSMSFASFIIVFVVVVVIVIVIVIVIFVVVAGANGAGKTTTFRMLINDLKPTAGEIIVDGINIHETV